MYLLFSQSKAHVARPLLLSSDFEVWEMPKLCHPFAALPKVSTMGSFFTITFFLAIRRTPSTSVTVTTMGRPSGMAATARLRTADTQQLQHRGQTTSTNWNMPREHFHGVNFPACTSWDSQSHSKHKHSKQNSSTFLWMIFDRAIAFLLYIGREH